MTPVIAIQNQRRLVIGRGSSTCAGVGTPMSEVVVVICALVESSGGVASADRSDVAAGDGAGAGAGAVTAAASARPASVTAASAGAPPSVAGAT